MVFGSAAAPFAIISRSLFNHSAKRLAFGIQKPFGLGERAPAQSGQLIDKMKFCVSTTKPSRPCKPTVPGPGPWVVVPAPRMVTFDKPGDACSKITPGAHPM